MSMNLAERSNSRTLDEDELAALERLSDNSEFFQSLLDHYWEYGELTPRQYAALVEAIYAA